ncbi:bifunctional diguanylate cyclase/phosphodiesterase [Massilia sp. PWRC2]|uniref:bifunctional diguanylate cyclase/phosphodiesterase n=1 Tax=Massilia sp. PWRC2 TaxID=2804626 RepID=UPI003CEDCC0D
MPLISPRATARERREGRASRRPRLASLLSPLLAALQPHYLRRGLETHISLPLFAVLLLLAIWTLTLHAIGHERERAEDAAREAVEDMVNTYEAQLSRNLGGIDQTLKVLKFAEQISGTDGALGSLASNGLLPSGKVFVVSIADRDGRIVASNPLATTTSVADRPYIDDHRRYRSGRPFVSQMASQAVSQTVSQPLPQAPVPSATSAPAERLYFTRRIDDDDGSFDGVAIIAVNPAYFTSSYEHSRHGAYGLLGMLGDDGVFRAVRIGDTVSWGQQAGSMHAQLARPAAASATPWDGTLRYTAMRALAGFPLSAVVALDQDEQLRVFERHRRNWLWAAAAGSVLLVLIVALVCAWSWQLSRTERRTRRAQETFAAAAEASMDAFFVMRNVYDEHGAIADFVIEATNERAEKLTGLRRQILEGGHLLDLIPSYRNNGIFDDMVKVAQLGGMREAEWRGDTERTRETWMHRQVVAVEGGVVAIVRDITERKRAEARIAHMAHHDALTGLPNRSLIGDRLDQAIRRARRKRGCVAVAFIDLDGFKLVNDGLGHTAGDTLLKVVSERMQACLRRGDTLGRFGGDEFVVILPDPAEDARTVTPVLEKMRQAVREPVLVAGQQVQVSCSMGVVMYPRDGADADSLLINADAAMYRAKELGSNSLQFYTRAMNASVEHKLVLLEGLRTALELNQFSILYQPKVDLRSGRIFGVEALIRWHHPDHGMVSPLRFIGLAEQSGLIVAIGDWVLRSACQQNMAWRPAGLAPLSVSVNVSPRQFEDTRLVERVAQALRESGLDAGALELEVTEGLIMRDLEQSVGKMRQLKAMGVALSIDDFGTGYSSLSALKSFPISSLKIDKSFVSELAENADDQAIAMAVISLGHKLNLRVIAEGVETEQQLRFLRDNDCDEMQGYLFSPAVKPEAIAELLRSQGHAAERIDRQEVPCVPTL